MSNENTESATFDDDLTYAGGEESPSIEVEPDPAVCETLTDQTIETFMYEAGAAGDDETVEICKAALGLGDGRDKEQARVDVAEILTEARSARTCHGDPVERVFAHTV